MDGDDSGWLGIPGITAVAELIPRIFRSRDGLPRSVHKARINPERPRNPAAAAMLQKQGRIVDRTSFPGPPPDVDQINSRLGKSESCAGSSGAIWPVHASRRGFPAMNDRSEE